MEYMRHMIGFEYIDRLDWYINFNGKQWVLWFAMNILKWFQAIREWNQLEHVLVGWNYYLYAYDYVKPYWISQNIDVCQWLSFMWYPGLIYEWNGMNLKVQNDVIVSYQTILVTQWNSSNTCQKIRFKKMAPKQTQIVEYLIHFNVSTQSFPTNTCRTIMSIQTIHTNLYLPHYHYEKSNFRQFSSPSQSSFYR